MDESTDIASMANLLAFIVYEHNGEIEEDFIFNSNATAEAIFDILNMFMVSSDIGWPKCIGLSTDGARAMMAQHSGVVKRVRDVSPLLTHVHCCIHREALAAKRMPMDSKAVLDKAVRMMNYIKSRPLQTRLFALLCEEMGSDHHQLLVHTEVRWLTWLVQLWDEVRIFFGDSKSELGRHFRPLEWTQLVLQGRAATIFHVHNTIEATVKKIDLWEKRMARANWVFQKRVWVFD